MLVSGEIFRNSSVRPLYKVVAILTTLIFLTLMLSVGAAPAEPIPNLPTPTPEAESSNDALVHLPPLPDELPPEAELERAHRAIAHALEKHLDAWGINVQVELIDVRMEGSWAYGRFSWDNDEIYVLAQRFENGVWQAVTPDSEDVFLDWTELLPDTLISNEGKRQLKDQIFGLNSRMPSIQISSNIDRVPEPFPLLDGSLEGVYFLESRFRYAPGVDDFDLTEWLMRANVDIVNCYISIQGSDYNFADGIKAIAQRSGVDTRLLFVLADVYYHASFLETSCDKVVEFGDQLDHIAAAMLNSTLVFRYGYDLEQDNEFSRSSYALHRKQTAFNDVSFAVAVGSVAIADLVGQPAHQVERQIYHSYTIYFGDPTSPNSNLVNVLDTLQTIDFKMPFQGIKYYTGGPHGGGTTTSCAEISVHDASGLDFAGNLTDKSVLAMAGGIVVGLKDNTLVPGRWVAIEHSSGWVSMYWHLESLNPSLYHGQSLNAGAYLGELGATGCPGCSPHIHIELRIGGSNYDEYSGIGSPVTWHGTSIDNWFFFGQQKLDVPTTLKNYNGTAIRWEENSSPVVESKQISTNNCGYVQALVEPGFPYNDETNYGITQFAHVSHDSPIESTNGGYCPPGPSGSQNTNNITNMCSSGDNIPPTATGFSASVSGGTATLEPSGVSDNPGGSGVSEVRFSAKFNNQWVGIGTSNTPPYSFVWNMCASGVPDGNVELGMEVWDNAGNVFVWSTAYPNPYITKAYNCTDPTGQVNLYSQANMQGTILHSLGVGLSSDPHPPIFSMSMPSGWSAITYDQDDGAGGSRCWHTNVNNFQDHEDWSNRLRSIRVFSSNVCPPKAGFDAWPQSGTVPLTVAFHNTSTNYSSCFWEYGNGAVGYSCNNYHNYTYNVPGTYTVKLTVSNAYGSDTRTRTNYITANSEVPTANFDAWPQSGLAPLTVSFHNTSFGDYTSCLWNYGDGNIGTSCNNYHDHIYDMPGTYSVLLTVTGPGGSDSKTITDYITVTTLCLTPNAPILLYPPDGEYIVNNTPTLTWQPASNANEYQVQISVSSQFGPVSMWEYVSSPQYTTPFLSGIWYWRVQSLNTADGCDKSSNWSPGRSFTIDTVPPTVNWISPVGNEGVFAVGDETVSLIVEATDFHSMSHVYFLRWDAINLQWIYLGSDYSQPYQYQLGTATINYAWNQINAVAVDSAGNSQTEYIWLDRYNCADPNEPNNAPGEATPIAYGSSIDGTICPHLDVDYYAFTGQAGDQIVIDVGAQVIGSTLDTYLYLLDTDGHTVLTLNDDAEGTTDSKLGYILQNDGTYYIKIRAYDHGNVGDPNQFYTLNLYTDYGNPTAEIISPNSGDWLDPNLQTIIGTASDAESGIRSVNFWYHDATIDDPYWFWMGAGTQGAAGWTIELDTSALLEQQGIAVAFRAYDWVNNYSDHVAHSLGVDRTPPTSAVQELNPIQQDATFLVNWNGTDNLSGIAWNGYDVQYRDGSDGAWTNWFTASGLTSANFTGQDGHTYYFRSRARDNAGNQETYTGGNGDAFTTIEVTNCHALTLFYTGSGSSPTASPLSSSDCPPGEYAAGETITVTPKPGTGYHLGFWTGTNNSSSNSMTMPASAHTVSAHYAYTGSISVAILDRANTADISYWFGGNSNSWNSYRTILENDPETRFAVTVVTELSASTLAGFDRLLLPDNAVPDVYLTSVSEWFAFPDRRMIAVDSASSYAAYSGFMWPESAGSNGYGVYWDYGSSADDQVVLLEDKITENYAVGTVLPSRQNDAQMFSTQLPSDAVVPTAKQADHDKAYVAYRQVPDKGAIVVLGPFSTPPTGLEALIRNAVEGSAPNNAPHVPSNPAPMDEAVGQSVSIVLAWTGGDPDPADMVTYDVYLDADTLPPTTMICNSIETTACAPGELSVGTTYSWYVTAADNHGATTTGPVWRFTTGLPSFTISKIYTSSRIAGLPVTYTLTVENVGDVAGTGLIITDAVPANTSYVSGGAYDVSTNVVSWLVTDLPAGESVQVQFAGQMEHSGQVVNDQYQVAGSNEGVGSAWGEAVTFAILPPTINAGFNQSAISIVAGESATFTDASSSNGMPIVAWLWDFGDGQTSVSQNPTHTYTAVGVYTVSLQVTDAIGHTAIYTLPEAVTVNSDTAYIYLPLIVR
jgi:uncharacterized repeat protein (TIGR01451 family)